MSTQITTVADIEAAARADYESARKHVSGRPAWGELDPTDPYDRGMKAHAYLTVTTPLDEHPEGWNGPCNCAICRSYAAEDGAVA